MADAELTPVDTFLLIKFRNIFNSGEDIDTGLEKIRTTLLDNGVNISLSTLQTRYSEWKKSVIASQPSETVLPIRSGFSPTQVRSSRYEDDKGFTFRDSQGKCPICGVDLVSCRNCRNIICRDCKNKQTNSKCPFCRMAGAGSVSSIIRLLKKQLKENKKR